MVHVSREGCVSASGAVSTQRFALQLFTSKCLPDGESVPLAYVRIRSSGLPLSGVLGAVATGDDGRATRGGAAAHRVSLPGEAEAPDTLPTMRLFWCGVADLGARSCTNRHAAGSIPCSCSGT